VTPDGYLYTIGGKSLLLTDWNDIFIAVDSFVDFDYNFALPGTENAVVFDVGANIGDTALVFASNPRIEKVFSFEPLHSIHRRLQQNLGYNPEIKDKIQSYAFGLGDSDAVIRVKYPEGCAYCATGTEDWHDDKYANTIEEDMVIRDAVPVVAELLATLPQNVVRVMKLDCEGAEFSLLPHLAGHGLLREFSLVMMEFHRTDPNPLVAVLEQNGFVVFWQNSLVGLTGRLYAAKKQQ
jgi:FkbM family methyltransferase